VDRSASLLRGCARSPCRWRARRSLRPATRRKYARALPRLRTSRVIRGRDFRPAGIRRQLRRTADDASQLFSTASGLGQLGNLMLQIGGHGLPCSSRLSLCVSRLATHARRCAHEAERRPAIARRKGAVHLLHRPDDCLRHCQQRALPRAYAPTHAAAHQATIIASSPRASFVREARASSLGHSALASRRHIGRCAGRGALAQQLEHGLSVIVAGDSFAVDQTGLHFEKPSALPQSADSVMQSIGLSQSIKVSMRRAKDKSRR
jgi:hypothetical protein